MEKISIWIIGISEEENQNKRKQVLKIIKLP